MSVLGLGVWGGGVRVSVRVELFIEPLLCTQLHNVSSLTISDRHNEFESSCPPFRCVEHFVFSNGRSCHAMVTCNLLQYTPTTASHHCLFIFTRHTICRLA